MPAMINNYSRVAALCAVTAIGGYLLGSANRPKTELPRTTPIYDENAIARSSHSASITSTKTRSSEQLTILKSRLLEEYANSPSSSYDLALREQAASILATMNSDELKKFVEELTAKNPNSTDDIGKYPEWMEPLLTEVFVKWSLKDPASACLGLTDQYRGYRSLAFEAWLQIDSISAAAWLESNPFPQGNLRSQKLMMQTYLRYLLNNDFSTALNVMGKLESDIQKKMLSTFSQSVANDPGK
jgi:hypothetical protein